MRLANFMQVVPGSFRPYPCDCKAELGKKHKPNCAHFINSNPKLSSPTWLPFIPQARGEQCGRCWQNHTPGFVCACVCHETDEERDIRLYPDNGDDLDAPQNT